MALDTENTQITVSTIKLRSKAESVEKLVGRLKSNLDILEQKVRATNTYWNGEAGDLHRELFVEQKKEISEMIKRLEEHPRDLIAIADTYEGIEREVEELGNQLVGNVIE